MIRTQESASWYYVRLGEEKVRAQVSLDEFDDRSRGRERIEGFDYRLVTVRERGFIAHRERERKSDLQKAFRH
jgi:hypothetical protein